MNESREAMLSRIREGLSASGTLLAREARRAEEQQSYPAHVLQPESSLVEQFSAELRKLTGIVHLCHDHEQALDELREILLQHQARELIAWSEEQIGLRGLGAMLASEGVSVLPGTIVGEGRSEQLARMEPARICLSGVDAAVAESGTMLVVSGEGRGRLASLLAPVHVAVLRESCLRQGLAGALAQLRERFGQHFLHDRSNLALISGPSRTADIEMSLTLGVHGPKEIHAIMLLGE
jgi:L-lactate dehydrogenase complex protein LldG